MNTFTRNIPLGRIQGGSRLFRIVLRIMYNDDWAIPVAMDVKYNGNDYSLSRVLSALLDGDIEPGNGIDKDALHALYRFWMLYKSGRSTRYTAEQNDVIIGEECRLGRRIDSIRDVQAILRGVGLDPNETYTDPPSVPEDAIEWLFSLPGDGATYEDIRKTLVSVSDNDFLTIISTAG